MSRRVYGFVIALIALAVMVAVTIAVFAWTPVGDTAPARPTIPAAESDPTPATLTDARPADGPIILDNDCQARRPCRF